MSESALRPFVEVAAGALDQRRIFAVRQDRVRSVRTGQEMTVDRLFAPNWVNVVAITDDNAPSLLLVRQWRFGARAFCDELPAGLVDAGESPRDAALRELLEETGYAPTAPDDVVHLGTTRPNPAFMNNQLDSYLVPRATKVATPKLDATEELEPLLLPVDAVDDAVTSGRLSNALGLVALFRWRLWAQQAGALSP